MDFECKEQTDLILIHSNKLNITQTPQLSSLNGTNAPAVTSHTFQLVTQYLIIKLDGKLEKGTHYQLFTQFTGELADDLGGFYRSEYIDAEGNPK